MTTPANLDMLVSSYLGEVDRALAGLPPLRRTELLADLAEHIEAGRAALDPPTEAGLRTVLDRLGDPATIAREALLAAADDAPPVPVQAPPVHLATRPWRTRPLFWVLVTVIVLIVVMCVGVGVFGFSSGHTTKSTPEPVAPASQQVSPS